MATKTLGGRTVEVDEQGYLKNAADWNEELAKALAADIGISEMTEGHWKVSKQTCSLLFLGSTRSIGRNSIALKLPPWATRVCTYQPGLAAYPECHLCHVAHEKVD